MYEALSYVTAPVRDDLGNPTTARLPMLDPHEVINYLVVTERVLIDDAAVRRASQEHTRRHHTPEPLRMKMPCPGSRRYNYIV